MYRRVTQSSTYELNNYFSLEDARITLSSVDAKKFEGVETAEQTLPVFQVKVSAEFQDIILECKEVLEVWIKKVSRFCVFSSFSQFYEFEQGKERPGRFCVEKLAKRVGTTGLRRMVKVYDKHQLSKSPFLLVDAAHAGHGQKRSEYSKKA
jgi:hypothetical protein